MAAKHAGLGAADDDPRPASAPASASACSSIPIWRPCAGRHRSTPTASSSTPSRTRARTNEGGRERQESFEHYAAAATLAHSLGVGINAGHDLDLDNLTLFRTLPHLDEVSIGHALISHALYVGLDRAVRDYLAVLTP